MNTQMISSPIRVGKKEAPNRIVFQPMECNDADSNGDPSDKYYRDIYLGTLKKAKSKTD
jgi:2,4-dienoyl-CoA reductase-like NADH-dependent reductase (Old Yellow Enzyme family)